MKHKLLPVVLIASLLLLLPGCGGSPATSRSLPEEAEPDDVLCIGVALYGVENDYMIRFASAASQYAKEQNIELELYAGDYDAATQIGQIEEMIDRHVDGIILVPHSAVDNSSCVDKAAEAGVPIISVNTRVEHEKLAAQIGSDDVEAGKLLMQETAKALDGQGVIAILEGPIGQSAQIDRREGMKKALQSYENIQVISCKTANWSELEARVVVQKWLETFDRLDAIIAESDSMALGAVAVCREQNREDIIIFGIDGSREGVSAVQRGEMWMTIFQNAEEQAQTALRVIQAAIAGERVDAEYWVPLEIVTKDNAADFWQE